MTNRLPRLSYDQQRRLAVANRLKQALRRWGLWVAFTLLLFSAGSNAPLAITASALAGCVAPLWWAWSEGPLTAAVLSLAYAGLAWGWLQATRPLIWSSRWRELEQQLPLSPTDVQRSDGAWLVLLLAPLGLACALGWCLMLTHSDLRLNGQALGSALSLALAMTLAWLAARQGLSRARRSRSITRAATIEMSTSQPPARVPLWKVLLWWPLRRGRLPRSRRLLLCMPVAVLAAWVCMLTIGAWPGLGLALGGAALMALAPLTAARLVEETRPLQDTMAHLPIAASQAERCWRRLIMLPALAGVLALGATLVLGQPGLWRGVPLCGWATLVVTGVAMDLRWRPRDPSHHSLRWWLLLVLMLAFASEVMP